MSQDTPSREELEEIFNYFDKDGSGKIDVSELESAIREYFSRVVGQEPTDKEVQEGVAVNGLYLLK